MRTTLVFLSLIFSMFLSPRVAEASTWRVTPDGAGETFSIHQAMAVAGFADTVLLGPGEYVIGSLSIADGIVLISEMGPHLTRFVPHPEFISGVAMTELSNHTEVVGIWFDGFDQGAGEELGALNPFACNNVRIDRCIFTNNDRAGVKVVSDGSSFVAITNCTFRSNTFAIVFIGGAGQIQNNILWDRLDGVSGNTLMFCNDVQVITDVPIAWRQSNFSIDPQFCGPDDAHVAITSPCASGNSPFGDTCALIGALVPTCPTTATERKTWGRVKAMYRSR